MKNLLPQVDQFLKFLLFFLTATSATTIFAQSISNISSGGNHSLILRSDGSLLVTGLNSNGQLGDGDNK